jgi:hypothetical protein
VTGNALVDKAVVALNNGIVSGAKTQRRFSARVQYRRFSFDVIISMTGMAPVVCLHMAPVSAVSR